MLEGVNVKPPSPTITVWVTPVAEGLGTLTKPLDDGVAGTDADADGAAEVTADGAAEEAAGGAAAPMALALKAPN